MKVYKPVSDREVARRLSVATINSAYYYLPIIREIFGLGLVICERTDRPQGEWIYCEDYVGHDGYKCSECGFFVPWCYDVYADCNFIRHYHTCPHCDSRMKGADDE